MASSKGQRLFWVRCEHDFISKLGDDLSFREGDLLYVTDVSNVNWWTATNVSDEKGQIPSNYVSVLPQYTSSTIQAKETILSVIVDHHESSSQAIVAEVTIEDNKSNSDDDTNKNGSEDKSDDDGDAGNRFVDNLDETQTMTKKQKTNVKTVTQVSQFTKVSERKDGGRQFTFFV